MMGSAEKQTNKRKMFYLFAIVGSFIVIMICIGIISKMMKPKVDYEGLYRDINAYTSQLENITDVVDKGDGIFNITLKNDSWYAGSEHYKMVYCKNVNKNITFLCQKYQLIKDTEWAAIYYYDEDGINIAEPSKKGYDLESNILH